MKSAASPSPTRRAASKRAPSRTAPREPATSGGTFAIASQLRRTAARELATTGSIDATAMIDRALQVLLSFTGEDEVSFYRLGEGRNGVAVTRWAHHGSTGALETIHKIHSAPPLDLIRKLASAAWEPTRITRVETQCFLERRALVEDDVYESSEFVNGYLVPGGLFDQQRLLVTHAGCLVGWLGLFRRLGNPCFSRADRRRLAPLVRPFVRLVATAATLDDGDPRSPGDLFMSATGRVEYASAAGQAWVDRPCMDALRAAVRQLDRGHDYVAPIVLGDRAEAHVLRLDGEGRVGYLVSIRPLGPVRLARSVTLPDALRDVAELAAAGASVAEIASLRRRSQGTIKNQLKDVYGRLGIASRVELATALSERPTHDGART